ncbi:BAH_G0016310.mRNA.1.CDS.1 [Saccharomyces cerevisiae]|nr:SX2_G0049710.mRNA.1.CDS.1 [Saccharomyces cerevisiae]CAI4450705.1 BAG_1a_G0016440.mRNA.1.CDS.1 [Saccharomyces cerevisiae]CAI4454114.1 BAH_G0016310.mRNA.1.CDS.1 [Saccharomyces cerevisiae]CAI7111637.1 BAH_G0016310.mRNA.1.CDS.1 [Saccharomyces cerevisiae]CAI7111964.1 BAG_1a_G0016440.mRNA.1.CDS.1 [Saccharomyces cerevisiae]
MTLGHESNGAVLEIEVSQTTVKRVMHLQFNIPFAASLSVTAPFVKGSWLTSTTFTDYRYSEFLVRVLCRCHYLSLSM